MTFKRGYREPGPLRMSLGVLALWGMGIALDGAYALRDGWRRVRGAR